MADDFTIRDRPGAPIGQTLKSPIERRQYTFDYSNWLNDGETVLGFNAYVVPQSIDSDPSLLVLDTLEISSDGLIGSVFATDGSEGSTYAIQLIAHTSIQRIKEDGLLVGVASDVDNDWMTTSCGCGGMNGIGVGLPAPPLSSLGLYAEQLTVTALNTLSDLKYPAWDSLTTMELIINDQVFPACITPPHFTVSGVHVSWVSTLHSLIPGDEVVARYRYLTQPAPSSNIIAATLYYSAVIGQTLFPLSVPDKFGQSWTLTLGETVNVSRNGGRLMPAVGSDGAYTVASNIVALLWPAGQGEIIAIDVYAVATDPSFLPSQVVDVYGNVVYAEQLTVTAPNTLSNLLKPPTDVATMELIVNGQVFAGCDSPAEFTVTGTTVNWLTPTYGLSTTDKVVARYIYSSGIIPGGGGGSPPGPDGPQGPAGPTGATGATGAAGATGATGAAGAAGAKGDKGDTGATGATGAAGAGTPSTATPLVNGTGAAGSATPYSREDHVHPVDTSRSPVVGVTDGSDAAAGRVGEVLSALQTVVVPLTTAVSKTVVSLVLSPGDWDIYGGLTLTTVAGGTNLALFASVSLTNNAIFISGQSLAEALETSNSTLGASTRTGLTVRPCRNSITTATTYYLVGQINGDAGNALGTLWARRAR